MKYYDISFLIFCIFFESFKSKSTQMLRPQNGNSFNDTLLNFGLSAQNLRKNILMKTSFETRVSRMG